MIFANTKWFAALLMVLLPVAAHEACAAGTDARASTPSIPSAAVQALPAGAGNVGSTAPSVTDELAALQREIPVLRARAEIAKLQADIATAAAAGQSTQPTQPARPATQVTGAHAAAGAPEQQMDGADDLGLLSVAAWEGHYVAMLQTGGRGIAVSEGDVLDGGWRVVHIDGTSVELSRRGQARRVGL
ncbi:type IV pilus biogenesis protein PilP [Paraburkholderia sp. BCC1885]|uniref:type IV pilus biogenesis protein PilP n=1 Tax=Paraburkholderia sp. BCC1885 TaxID=2562669 RepID=UPI0011845384|nr:type IV pilus biogenesis protein PilP [Paraburkholderia sp. BCC1885]